MNFKEIHIGTLINQLVTESGIEISRICNFLKCSEEELEKMYQAKSLDTEVLLRWSKLLEYDFFRIYSQHLILYAPPFAGKEKGNKKSNLPRFRKNIYTKEVIDFILEQLKQEK
ncbi:Transposase [Empedobacter stercoris]